MRFLGRSLTALFLAALTAGLLAWAAQITFTAMEARQSRDAGAPPAQERVLAVNVVRATPETITPVLTTFGEIRARRILELRAPGGGRVVELAEGFEEGAAVREGEVLMRIDPAAAEADLAVARADLAGAEAELRDAERGLDLARAELAGAQAQRDLQQQALDRQEDLAARGVGAAATVETAKLSLSSAEQTVLTRRGALVQAEARIDTARLGIDRARIALAQAERDLEDRILVAAFDGQLTDVAVLAGGLVSANERVARLIDPDALEVAFRLSAAQHARLLDGAGDLIGADLRVVLDVEGLTLAATGRVIREAAAVGEGQTGRLVYARLGDAPGFRPGDFVRVEVEEPPLDDAIRLPATALSATSTVLLLGADERLEEAEVTLLRRQGDEVLVGGDIADRVVVAERGPALGTGIRVRPLSPGTADEAKTGADRITLDPERRARLVAFLQSNTRIPPERRSRLLAQLEEETVPAAMVARLEARLGG
ncbi:Efflux pump periplasmic linker BepD precursor [Jannaschia seosinensis]|uniref:Efflux pump periplasmic linker BepD n=1 Tax=Jannaschia seosinensis TaxID=313367 RepID=A0A0M7B9S8_9RHOB|nr:HlyD family efflux transporter periplasmic adaptor subunit [Jannaschia seosinensis]CUH38419.1 Efflux pump periplasmic linker BepD precursor [Jannaschia seosinensis]